VTQTPVNQRVTVTIVQKWFTFYRDASFYETLTAVFDFRKATSMREAAIWLLHTALTVVMAYNDLTAAVCSGFLSPLRLPTYYCFKMTYITQRVKVNVSLFKISAFPGAEEIRCPNALLSAFLSCK
jgi:hypothetical protein